MRQFREDALQDAPADLLPDVIEIIGAKPLAHERGIFFPVGSIDLGGFERQGAADLKRATYGLPIDPALATGILDALPSRLAALDIVEGLAHPMPDCMVTSVSLAP